MEAGMIGQLSVGADGIDQNLFRIVSKKKNQRNSPMHKFKPEFILIMK